MQMFVVFVTKVCKGLCLMKKVLFNISLFISSFVPLYILVVVKTIIEIINDNLHFNITNTILLCLMIVLSIIGCFGVYVAINKRVTIKQVTIIDYTNTTDKHFLGYFSLFVLFALTFDLSKVSMSVVYIIILILIGIVYVRNHLFNINPLLNIIGYSCYNVKYVDLKGEECSTQIYYKGKLNYAKYKISIIDNGICFVIKQITSKQE